jgi:hypothetical protein
MTCDVCSYHSDDVLTLNGRSICKKCAQENRIEELILENQQLNSGRTGWWSRLEPPE